MPALTRNCLQCGQPMVIRRNRTNDHEFLGCSAFPRCAHAESLPEWFRLKAQGAPELPLEVNDANDKA